MRKVTSWELRKCCSFWDLEVLNHSYRLPKFFSASIFIFKENEQICIGQYYIMIFMIIMITYPLPCGHLAHDGALWAPQFTKLWRRARPGGAVGPLGARVGRVAPTSGWSPNLWSGLAPRRWPGLSPKLWSVSKGTSPVHGLINPPPELGVAPAKKQMVNKH